MSLVPRKARRSTRQKDGRGEISWWWVLGRVLNVAREIWTPGGKQRDFLDPGWKMGQS